MNKLLKSHWVQSELDSHYGFVFLNKGEYEKALHHYDAFADICRKSGYDSAQSYIYFYQSILKLLLGEEEEALELAEASYEYAHKIGSDYHKAQACGILTHLCYVMGRKQDCMKYANEAGNMGTKFDKNMKTRNIGMIRMARAEGAMVCHNWDEGDILYKEAISIFSICPFGKIMQALASTWYGDALFILGRKREAKSAYEDALYIFRKLGNERQMRRCEELLLNVQ